MLLSLVANQAAQRATGSVLEPGSGGLEYKGSCLKGSAQEISVVLLPGTWRLDVWKASQHEAFMKDTSLRSLGVKLSYESSRELVGNIQVTKISERYCLTFDVESNGADAAKENLVLSFSTDAIFKPVKFRFVFEKLSASDSDGAARGLAGAPLDAYSDSEEGDEAENAGEDEGAQEVEAIGPRYSIEWLELQYKNLTFDDKYSIAKAVRTAQSQGWPSLDGACAAYYDNSMAVAEMARSSEYKEKALSLGLIRPFLLLVSMHPGRRIGWAISLEIKLMRNKKFGDAHWEAFEILTNARKGVVPRVSKTFREQFNPLSRDVDWYNLLFRVLNHLARPSKLAKKGGPMLDLTEKLEQLKLGKDDSKGISSDADLAIRANQLENLFAQQLLQLRAEDFFTDEDYVNIEAMKKSGTKLHLEVDHTQKISRQELTQEAIRMIESHPELKAKAAILKKHGIEYQDGLAFIVLNAFHKSSMPVHVDTGDLQADLEKTTQSDETDGPIWNTKWGSQSELFAQEFKDIVAGKSKMDQHKTDAKAAVGIIVPVIASILTLHPTVAIVMCSRAAIKRAFPTLPASVASIISGMILQKHWLYVSDIGLEQYYS